MNESEEVTPEATRLRRYDSLSCDRCYRGIDSISPVVEDALGRQGTQRVRCGNRVQGQGIFRSGSTLFRASRTALTIALVSSSST